MAIEDMIYTKLTATTALTDIVSTRIYPLFRPQDSTTPSVVYWRVSNPVEFMFSSGDEIVMPRFQFDCYAVTFSSARSIASKLKSAIDRWATSSGTPIIFRTDVVNEYDSYDPELEIYLSSVDAIIHHLST